MSNVLALPAHLSFSQVTNYLGCGERYRLERLVQAEQKPQGHFLGGSAVHECMEHALKTGEDPASLGPMFATVMVRAVDEAGGEAAVRWGGRASKAWPQGESLAWWLSEFGGPAMLTRGGEVMRQWASDGWSVAHVETQFEFTVNGKQVKARPDVVLHHEDTGVLCIADWKTGQKPTTGGIQAAMYAMAIRAAVYGQDAPVTSCVVLLRKDGAERVVAYDPERFLEVAQRMIRDFIAGTEEGIFALSPSNLCSACTVRQFCAFGQTLPNGEEE